jgi:hypothetical protein
MTLAELQSYIGSLTNDPNHDRYSLSDINSELDNAETQWNEEIKILKQTTTITVVTNQRQYLLTLITGTPIQISRVTHKGILLEKRSKEYFDLYVGTDWTQDIGTPTEYFVEATDPNNLYLTLHPTPQSNDAGAYLVVETVVAHTPMSASTDVPWMLGTASNYILRPYDFYLANSTAARLLARDPSELNNSRAAQYLKLSGDGKANLVQVMKALEAEEPKRLRGGRYWNSGYAFLNK